LQAPLGVRNADFNFAIKAAGAAAAPVKNLGDVGRADDDHLPRATKPSIKLSKLRHTRFSTSPDIFARLELPVNFIYKQDRRAWRAASSKTSRSLARFRRKTSA